MDLTCPHLSTPEERFLAVLGVIGIILNLLLLFKFSVETSFNRLTAKQANERREPRGPVLFYAALFSQPNKLTVRPQANHETANDLANTFGSVEPREKTKKTLTQRVVLHKVLPDIIPDYRKAEVVFTALSEFGRGEMEPKEPRNDTGKKNSKEVADPVSMLPKGGKDRWRVDLEDMLGITSIVGTVLNLLVVVLVYAYTPI
ncbi:hypothetical protein FQN60_005048 [Etheostoma spectabile]|uniref:Uncharacterized protein n=1 Tax=Etheostoma spectabile TaxID=54343 RepID=A0A5J5DLI0_9PERO|nr:hypothetical protein FQN60_005048 [Etheostoma spectabile]